MIPKLTKTYKIYVLICMAIIIGCSEDSSPEEGIDDALNTAENVCENITCENGGNCVDGSCNCPDGFEGEFCENTIDPCADINCENGGTCIDGSCACPDGFEGEFCETFIDPCADVSCENGGTCVDGNCACPDGFEGEFCEQISGLRFQTEFGSTETLNVATNGIFAIWWSPDFEHSQDLELMFEYLNKVREDCLTIYGMEDPPNPQAGFYYNVYIHHGSEETVLPTYWGNGQGTDSFGMPFLTLPDGAHNEYSNLSHEGFHIFQYNANSPGFAYSGDSQWYVESSAQWYMSQNVPNEINTFIEAGTIYANPHVALWHSFSNEAPGDPKDWFFQVRQYGMHLLLYYLTEEKDVDPQIIAGGYYTNTTLSPQEYLYQGMGGNMFRNYFADWAARNTGGFDYFSQDQLDRAWYEMDAVGDPDNKNPYALELLDTEINGTYSPPANLIPRGWSYNVIKIDNSLNTTYTISLNGEATGSEGASAHFEGRIIVKNSNSEVRYFDIDMVDALNGSISLDVSSNDSEIYINVISAPENFGGNQTYNYELEITKL